MITCLELEFELVLLLLLFDELILLLISVFVPHGGGQSQALSKEQLCRYPWCTLD